MLLTIKNIIKKITGIAKPENWYSRYRDLRKEFIPKVGDEIVVIDKVFRIRSIRRNKLLLKWVGVVKVDTRTQNSKNNGSSGSKATANKK